MRSAASGSRNSTRCLFDLDLVGTVVAGGGHSRRQCATVDAELRGRAARRTVAEQLQLLPEQPRVQLEEPEVPFPKRARGHVDAVTHLQHHVCPAGTRVPEPALP